MNTRTKKKRRSVEAVSLPAEIIIHLIVGTFAVLCILPFIFVIIISFTDESSIASYGYQLLPNSWSLEAYRYVFEAGAQLARSYFVSFVITIGGTALSLVVTCLYSYALSRRDFSLRGFFTFFIFFTMLFSGGLVPFFIMVRNVLGLANTPWALILPLLLSPFNVIVMRTFFVTSIPDSLIEAAHIDGSGEYRTLLQIVLPLAKPGIATIGLLTALAYWNDWFNAMLFIDNTDWIPLQFLLMRIERETEFMVRNAGFAGAHMAEMLRGLPRESMRMAIVVLTVTPIAMAYPFFQRYFISGLTIGAVKG